MLREVKKHKGKWLFSEREHPQSLRDSSLGEGAFKASLREGGGARKRDGGSNSKYEG